MDLSWISDVVLSYAWRVAMPKEYDGVVYGTHHGTWRMGVFNLAACATLSLILLAARTASLLPGSSYHTAKGRLRNARQSNTSRVGKHLT